MGLALCAAGCSQPTVVNGAARTSPTAVPDTEVRDGACVTSPTLADGGQSRHGLVTVHQQPRGARAVWLPGMNQRPCTTAITYADASAAAGLAADIDHAPAVDKGAIINCPLDDASAVRLSFDVGAGPATDDVTVSLRGCTWVSAPGREPRRASQKLLRDLAALAPRPWADALRQWTS